MDRQEDFVKTIELRKKLHERLEALRQSVERCGGEALERVYQERMDTYFAQQERLDEIEGVLVHLAGEIESSPDLGALKHIAGRLTFLEDHYDEIDSRMFNRPAKKRRGRFNLFEFLNQWERSKENGAKGEVRDEAQARRELGVEPETKIDAITAIFRKRVKELHPDQNGGDRSSEPRFRKLVAAYTYLKKRFKKQTA